MASQQEDLGRKLIRETIGAPARPWPTKKFSFPDVSGIRDKAIRNFNRYPHRLRLEGMITDLSESDLRSLAFFEASVEVLNSLGVLDLARFEAVFPAPYTTVQEVIDEGVVGHHITKQK